MTKQSVFLSQTSGRSNEFSLHVWDWLRASPVFGVIEPWHSDKQKSLTIGAYQHQRIVEASKACQYCISVLTPENLEMPWVNFEAGLFFAKPEDPNDSTKPIVTMLCGNLTHNDIAGNHPLQPIYSVKANSKNSLLFLLEKLNSFSNNGDNTESLKRFIKSSLTDELINAHDEIFSEPRNKIIDAKRGLRF